MNHAICPKCGKELPADAKFCFACGAEVPSVTTCPKCGRELSTEAKFCTYCGATVSTEAVSAQPATPVAAAAPEAPKAEQKISAPKTTMPKISKPELPEMPKLSRKALVAIGGGAAALLLVLVLALSSGSNSPSASTSTADPVNASAGVNSPSTATLVNISAGMSNVLMADTADGITNYDTAPVFGSDIKRTQIISVTFFNTMAPLEAAGWLEDGAWDVSEAQDSSVMAYAYSYDDDSRYDLFICADGNVIAPTDCSYMFAGYLNMTDIDFNGVFNTENTTSMQGMFANCVKLTTFYTEGWDTSNVTDMAFMFYYCWGLKTVTVDNWDTSNVTDMTMIFYHCEWLEDLEADNWDTVEATKDNMFENCDRLSASVKNALLNGGTPSTSSNSSSSASGNTTTQTPSTPSSGGTTDQKPSSSSGTTATQPSSNSSSGTTTKVSGTKTLVVAAMTEDPLAYTVTKSSVYVQNLGDFTTSDLTVKAPSKSSDGLYQSFSFSGGESGVAVLEEFVNTICNGSYNLTMIKQSSESYKPTLTTKGGDYVSWAINYTGTGKVTYTTKASFSNAQCNMYLWYSLVRGKLEGGMFIPAEMDIVDLGLRYGGKKETTGLAGPSAMEALYRLPNGNYTTGDGRLTAAPGYANVLRDGKSYSVPTSFVRDEKNSKEMLWVRNFYRDETIYLATPISRLMTGDVYTLKDLVFTSGTKFNTVDDFDNYKYNPFFGLGHNGDAITPRDTAANQFEDLTVRVMYWKSNVEAVYYVYAKLSGAPYEIEALCSVDLTDPEVSSSSSSSGSSSDYGYDISSPERKKIDCPTCGGSGRRDCKVCDGAGKLRTYEPGGDYDGVSVGKWGWKDCTSCNGNGWKDCTNCRGTGKI